MQKIIQDYGNILDGSLYEKYFKCGKKNCKCYDDPIQRHGPYWVWSRRVNGKIMQKQLNEKQLEHVKEGLANYKKLLKEIEKAKEVCEKGVLK
jgi:hypothetical protein